MGAGETIEIAGYDLAPALAADLDLLRLDPDVPPNVRSLHWFDVAAEDGRPMPPASTRLIERWRGRGAAVDARAIKGEAFWALLETTVAPNLIGATAATFA
jgi:hypothetical protein